MTSLLPSTRPGPAATPGDLAALVRRFWLTDPEGLVMHDSPVVTTFGELPPTHRPVEVYVVAPNLRAPRYLVPAGCRQAVAAAFAHDLASPSWRTRLAGRAVAAGWWSGAAEPVLRARLVVGVDRRVPERQLREWLLLRHLSSRLRHEVAAVLQVRPATPLTKPTARLIDRSGVSQGYLKVGWSPATKPLVRNEARVLWSLRGRAGDVIVPRLRDAGSWQGLDYVVTAPLPALRRMGRSPEAMSRLVGSVAASEARPLGDPRRPGPAGARPDGPDQTGHRRAGADVAAYLRTLEGRLAGAAASQPAEVAALGALLARVRRSSPRPPLGRWHGDWVPSNVGQGRSGTVAWDWEHSQPAVPVGFDLLHWRFQLRLAERDATLADAAAEVYDAAPQLAELGVPEQERSAVATLYLLEILTRETFVAAQGGGWDPRLHQALSEVVEGAGPGRDFSH
ncbi:hypothetical protein [Nocardioides mesophilus]|uniref:Phosphotransferase n=1 Tax=Nocardioides mesophilus TaxID=433659 RepID=A0A7G9REL8_9ACTN|nr:hypothetical protein [Nocardioides mesophilus]QNN54043.1 hypothetical protein H9L09_06595 [Nocardioides mesophilus]